VAARGNVRDTPGAALASAPAHRLWPDAVLLALGALLVRLPAYFAPTNLGYDDGGYGLAAVAMRQGYAPFRDIFSSQGPLFLPLVHVFDRIGFETQSSPRLLSVVAGLAVTVAVYVIGAELFDRARALLAGGITATSGVLLWTTGPLTSDGTVAAFATGAVAVACTYRRRPSVGKAVAIGLLIGGAVGVKHLLAGPAVLVAWLLVLAASRAAPSGRRLDAALVPAIAVALVIAASVPWGENVVADNIRYHLDKTGDRRPVANIDKLVTTFVHRDTMLVAVGATGLIASVLTRRRRRQDGDDGTAASPDETGQRGPARLDRLLAGPRLLWWWMGLALVLVVLQEPMFRNHLAVLVPPLALVVARFRPPWIVVGVASALALGLQAVELRPLLVPRGYSGQEAVAARHLDALPPDAWVLSDEPGLVWRAGLGTDPYFTDPSEFRFLPSQASAVAIDEARLVQAAANPRVCAVIVRSPRRFGTVARLPARLAERGYEVVADFGDGRGVYMRSCPADRSDSAREPPPDGRGRAGRTSAAVAPARSPG